MGSIKRIVLLTPGQPSSNPRLLKEAICLSEAGYSVTVLYCYWARWAYKADMSIKSNYNLIRWIEVGGNPYTNYWKYFYTRLRHKVFRCLYQLFPENLFLAERSALRSFSEMLKVAVKLDAGLYIAHNLGALAVAGHAAKRKSVPFGFDAEDFHRGQTTEVKKEYRRTVLLENSWIPKAGYMTSASPLIAAAYENICGIKSTVINNVFSFKYMPKEIKSVQNPIRLFWFSQMIGPDRGLEDIIVALKHFQPGFFTLTLMGDISSDYNAFIRNLCLKDGKKWVNLKIIEPVESESVFSIVLNYDVGLALEPGRDLNNQIALSNKIFTYLLCCTAIILSATSAQAQFFKEYSNIGWCYKCGDVEALKNILEEIINNPLKILGFKKNARMLAVNNFNWEIEQQKFKKLINSIFDRNHFYLDSYPLYEK